MAAGEVGVGKSLDSLGEKGSPKENYGRLNFFVTSALHESRNRKEIIFDGQGDDLSILISSIISGLYNRIFGDDPMTHINHQDITKEKAVISAYEEGDKVTVCGSIIGITDTYDSFSKKLENVPDSAKREGVYFIISFDKNNAVASLSGLVGFNDNIGVNPKMPQHLFGVGYKLDNTSASRPCFSNADMSNPLLKFIDSYNQAEGSANDLSFVSPEKVSLGAMWRLQRGPKIVEVQPVDPDLVRKIDKATLNGNPIRGQRMASGGRRSF